MRNILLIQNRQIIMLPEPINVLTIQFANEISQQEIPLFRGAVNHSLENKSVLFHNHEGDKFRYSYPLIQYKRIRGKAAILCIGKGTESVQELFSSGQFLYQIGEKNTEMKIESIYAHQEYIKYTDNMLHYKLKNWLPLNSKNYQQFIDANSLVNKVEILERVLIGNILSFLKGVDIHLEEQLKLSITNISNQHLTTYKKVKLMAFDIEFNANITLPPHFGIGKNASIGYGVLSKRPA